MPKNTSKSTVDSSVNAAFDNPVNPLVWLDDMLVPLYETPEDAYNAYLAGELSEDELLAIGETFEEHGAY